MGETHGTLGQCVSFSLIDAGSVLLPAWFFFSKRKGSERQQRQEQVATRSRMQQKAVKAETGSKRQQRQKQVAKGSKGKRKAATAETGS